MKQNVSRDLLLLAAVAYRQGRFDTAGSMFAASMSADDADELLSQLDVEGDLAPDGEGTSDQGENAETGDAPRTGLAAIASTIEDAMSAFASTSSDEEDEEDEDLPDVEDDIEEDTDDADSDDFNPEVPGQKIIPSSLSSSNQGGGERQKVVLVMGSSSPVRVK